MDSDGSVRGPSSWFWWQRGTLALQDPSHTLHAASGRAALRCLLAPQKQMLHTVSGVIFTTHRDGGSMWQKSPTSWHNGSRGSWWRADWGPGTAFKAYPCYFLSRANTHFVKFLLPPKIAPWAGVEEFDMRACGDVAVTTGFSTWAKVPEITTLRLNYLWIKYPKP